MYELIQDYGRAVFNIFVFLPYYFSVDVMVRTMFAPWRRIAPKTNRVGFSFSQWGEDLMFSLISRMIGSTMRLSVLVCFLIILVLYVPVTLICSVFFFLFIVPISYGLTLISKSPEEKYREAKSTFVLSHTVDARNQAVVEAWYDRISSRLESARRWWELKALMSTPPLARDWAQGYTPTLDQYSTDLSTDASYHDKRPMTIGRESELKEIEDVLCKSQDANILLTGVPGVGKTTLVESLAYRIYVGHGNPLLAFKRLVDLNLEKILSQNTDQKIREEILSTLLKEAHEAGNIIIVIGDIDRYVSSGQARVDLSIPLEKYLSQPGVQVIGTTTPQAYERYIRIRSSLARHLHIVSVPEISPEVALAILMDHHHRFEDRYQVTIPYETLVQTIKQSAYFVTTIPFPEKSLQLLDDACVFVKNSNQAEKRVLPETIDHVLSQKIHVPTSLDSVFKQKLLGIGTALDQQVIGQKNATKQITEAIQRAFVMLGKRNKPLATFLLLGPTGVGKTETAKAIAQYFFDKEDSLIRFDMSEYQQVSDIAKLIGNATTGEPGLLIAALRQKPYGVLLLDEIEKASGDLLNIFLTVLDEGYLTDSNGDRVDCKSHIVIATSNAGAADFYQARTHDVIPPTQDDLLRFLIEKHLFTPEFLNRFDGVIGYDPIDITKAVQIGKMMLDHIAKDINALHEVHLVVSDATVQSIITKHFNPAYGARDLSRALSEEIETIVAQKLLSNSLKPGDTVTL
ncbi:MAG: AAA family ATPase [Candidatus Roizmanbacteria bacterium]